MNKSWQRYLDAASGFTNITQQRAERVVKSLVKQGELAAERAERAVDELLKRSEINRKAIAALVRTETEKAVSRLGLARQEDVERLERKIAQLEQRTAATAAKKSTAKRAKKSTAKKSTAKKSTAKRAKKSSPGSSS